MLPETPSDRFPVYSCSHLVVNNASALSVVNSVALTNYGRWLSLRRNFYAN